MNGHPCPTSLCSSSMMNIREYCFSFRHLIQADLVFVDRLGIRLSVLWFCILFMFKELRVLCLQIYSAKNTLYPSQRWNCNFYKQLIDDSHGWLELTSRRDEHSSGIDNCKNFNFSFSWVGAPWGSKGRPEAASLWVSSPPRRQTDKQTPNTCGLTQKIISTATPNR